MTELNVNQKKAITYVLYLIGFLDLLGVSAIIPLMTHRIRELGGNAATAGLFGSLYGALQLFSGPLVGSLSDVIGRRRVMILCLLLTSLGYLLLGLSNTLLFMAVARLPSGIFKHSSSIAKAYIADIYDSKQQPGIYGKFNSISNVGFVVGPLFGGHLAMTDNGFLKVSILSAIIFFVNGLLALTFITTDDKRRHVNKNNSQTMTTESNMYTQADSENIWKTYDNMKKIPWSKVSGLLAIRFVMAMSVLLFRGGFSIFLEDHYHANTKTIGYVLSFNGVIGGLSGLVIARLSELYKGNSIKAVLHCDIIMALSVLGCTASSSLWIFCCCLIPLSISSNMARVHFTSMLVNSGKGEERGALIGIGQSTISFGRMLTPTITGFLQVININLPGLFSTVMSVVAAVFLSRLKPIKTTSKLE